MAEQLVSTLSEEFHLEKYHDEFRERLKQLIEAKQQGKAIATEPNPHRAPVIDMMAALKKSLETTGARQKKPVRAKAGSGHARHSGHHRAAS